MDSKDLIDYLADSPSTIVNLPIKKHFEALSDKEQRYAHFISKAAWAGTRIILRQVSPESESIFDFILALHKSASGDWSSLKTIAGISDEDFKQFFEYTTQFLGNSGNYKSFGDSKFVPRCEEKVFKALAATSPEAEKYYEATKGAIFSSNNLGIMHLGYPEEGHLTNYYPASKGITKAEIEAVGVWMGEKGLLAENTRIRKTSEGHFDILIASAVMDFPADGGDIGKTIEFTVADIPALQNAKIKLVYGDHNKEMTKVVGYQKQAATNAANDIQKSMHEAYAEAFNTGSMKTFKHSQRFWIRDTKPAVECNIGFIETYRDPKGVRGEWEGFVSMVNLSRSRAFNDLVDNAPSLIPYLPWSKEFEKDKFFSPDFTSLEVLTFSSAGVPSGINIPNFDDIRMTEGFKNVSLGNVLSARPVGEKIPFISEADLPIYTKYRDPAFEVQVGVHELLGHGTGKILQETSPGCFNFDRNNPPISPIDNKPVTTWYKPGQTWGAVFGSLSGTYEECRAEAVAMYLGCNFEVLKIFGHGDGKVDMDGEAGDVLYASYLTMARAGIASLEMWDPKSQKWGQAHSQARFSVLQCFLTAGDDFCKLDYKEDDLSDLTIKLDRNKILSTGREAIRLYLQKLHIYKVTADLEAATKMYDEMTNVNDWWATKVRDQVMKQRQPRKVFVQANTALDEVTGKVSLVEYEPTPDGIIQSFAERDV